MSGYAQYLKDLLRPLRVYELEGTANGGEVEAQGQEGPGGLPHPPLRPSLFHI